jgi:hypothetical protein
MKDENELQRSIRYRDPEERVRSQKGLQAIMVSGSISVAGYALSSLASGCGQEG